MRVATPILNAAPASHAMRAQAALSKASTELTTGRLADPGIALGAGTRRVASLDAAIADLTASRAANAHARTGLDAMQAALSGMREAAERLTGELVTTLSTGGEAAATHAARASKGLLATLIGHANVAVAGAHPFGGTRASDPPLADPARSAPAREAVADAFAAAFGHSIDDPATATIDAASMAGFLDGFEASFPTIYATRFAGDAPDTRTLRVAPGETASVPVTSHDPGLRDFVLAASLGAALADAPLSGEARGVALDRAVGLAGRATGGLNAASGRLGLVGERLGRADAALAAREVVATQARAGMVAVDPAEAAARVQALASEVEASLAVTARISRLSLLNYL